MQKINEEFFKQIKLLKNNDVDMEAAEKYFDSIFKDETWKQNFKAAGKKCYQEISKNFTAIQAKFEAAPFNVKKESCNVKFMAMMTCITLEGFVVSRIL